MKVVEFMSPFKIVTKRQLSKRRNEICEDAKVFIQVHFVRERSSGRYEYNVLSLKDDPERDNCRKWYEENNNPSTFSDAIACHTRNRNIDTAKLANSYHLDSKMISRLANEKDYKVTKGDAVAICLALKLNLPHSIALLKLAGYNLTNSSQSDLIIRYCIENKYTSFADVSYILNEICNTSLKEIS